MTQVSISVDAMGGDFDPHLAYEACIQHLRYYKSDKIIAASQASIWLEEYQKLKLNEPELAARLLRVDAPGVVGMDDKPAKSLRYKQDSSMWHALQLLADGDVQACVSSGNTGALMAMSRHLVKTIPGIQRPAICKPIPTARDVSYLLDLGANINCSVDQLTQFACMGAAFAAINGIVRPKVALLNIGVEQSKGLEYVRQAASRLETMRDIHFVGFVEGDGLYRGDVDVVVCDGFVGNVALKVSEGLAKFVAASLREQLSKRFLLRLVGLLVAPIIRPWAAKLDPSLYNGAAMLGLNKVVVKSHGNTNVTGLMRALEAAREQVLADVPAKISALLPAFEQLGVVENEH